VGPAGGEHARANGLLSGLGLQGHLGNRRLDLPPIPESGDGVALLAQDLYPAPDRTIFAFHFSDRALEVELIPIAAGHRPQRRPVHDHQRWARLRSTTAGSEGNWLEMLYEPPPGIVSNQPAFNQIATTRLVWRIQGPA